MQEKLYEECGNGCKKAAISVYNEFKGEKTTKELKRKELVAVLKGFTATFLECVTVCKQKFNGHGPIGGWRHYV